MIRREDVMTNPRMIGLVKRYHTWPVIREQNVAEHTWHVMRIYLTLFPGGSASTYEYMLYHDVEIKSGDLPYPVKIKYPALRPIIDQIENDSMQEMNIERPSLSPREIRQVKICDLLEMWEFCLEELSKGNKYAEIMAVDCGDGALAIAREISEHFHVRQYMDTMQEKLCGS